MRPYAIRQGDYLTALAQRMGFDADSVWNHGQNASLRERRSNPEMLAPGDILFVPPAERPAGLALSKGGHNRFTATPAQVPIRLIVSTEAGAVANEPFVVEGAGRPIEGTTDAEGLVEFRVPTYVREVRVVLEGADLNIPVRIGHLDPITEASGVSSRLAHLGFLAPGAGPIAGADPWECLGGAVADFQEATGLTRTGRVDDETRDALTRAHGS